MQHDCFFLIFDVINRCPIADTLIAGLACRLKLGKAVWVVQRPTDTAHMLAVVPESFLLL